MTLHELTREHIRRGHSQLADIMPSHRVRGESPIGPQTGYGADMAELNTQSDGLDLFDAHPLMGNLGGIAAKKIAAWVNKKLNEIRKETRNKEDEQSLEKKEELLYQLTYRLRNAFRFRSRPTVPAPKLASRISPPRPF